MCGLAALFEPGRRFNPGLLAGMEDDLFHRGPDSGGTVSEPGFALVFRRLAILDPVSQADQPMSDASGRCSVVFNGEIYNYRALRRALEQEGVSLRTQGDTEVVLEGYLRWGEDVLSRLEGMFAFCLVDRERGVALAARDVRVTVHARRESKAQEVASSLAVHAGPWPPAPFFPHHPRGPAGQTAESSRRP